MTTRVFLPANVANWIAQQFPLVDLKKVQFRLGRRIPFWWIMPHRTFSGLTLWNRIYLVENCWCVEPLSSTTLAIVLHELAHVVQYRRNPFTFPLRYVIDSVRYGYEGNPAEVEAREMASKLIVSFFDSWKSTHR